MTTHSSSFTHKTSLGYAPPFHFALLSLSQSEAPCQPEAGFHGRELSKHTAMNKLEDSGDRFGDYLRVNFNLP